MSEMNATDAREAFAEVLNRAAYGKERVVLTRRGKRLAVLVPIEDLEMLEELEDREDLKAARKVLADMKAKGEKPIPLARVKKDLGF